MRKGVKARKTCRHIFLDKNAHKDGIHFFIKSCMYPRLYSYLRKFYFTFNILKQFWRIKQISGGFVFIDGCEDFVGRRRRRRRFEFVIFFFARSGLFDVAVFVHGDPRFFLEFLAHVGWDEMRPRDKQGIRVHVSDVEFAALEFGHEIGNAVALVIHGFPENVFGHDEPNVLFGGFIACGERDAFMDAVQEFVENGHLFQIAFVAFVIEGINIDLTDVLVVVYKQKT